jgi:serine/threonine protein kinase
VPEKDMIAPGKMLSAYRITELIGKGGFSQVWSAWDTRLNRLVAIKIIPTTGMDAHNTIQFGREAAMVTRLEHPHILPLYDFGESPDFRFLVMRYVTGGSLAERIDRGRLAIPEVLRLMNLVASTLDYIHEQRVVHRDLKPGNILLDVQGLPYLTDFGLAKELTDETKPMHSASGTLTFMPPEQFSGGVMSVRSDQYSFGILLYQLFTGQLPYDGKIALGMRQLNRDEKMPDVTQADPKLPHRLNEYLWQLTDLDPMLRPESCAAIMNDITELMKGIDSDDATTPSVISVALESGDYRQREAESLIQLHVGPWQKGEFTLSLTHFVLLDILLRNLPSLLNGDVRSLMLRGALECNQQVDYWWKECTDAERQRACWHAAANGDDAVRLHAVTLAVTTLWVRHASNETINNIGRRLMPISDFTPTALEFLERALPARHKWEVDERFAETDDNLRALAMSKSPLANRAAALIGTARRTRALLALPTLVGVANPILVAYETAGSLPDEGIPMVERLRLALLLAVRQLTRDPLAALNKYGWAAAGNALALGFMVFMVTRYGEAFFSNWRVGNTLGQGLMYGLIYGVGVWLARHVAQRLRVVPFWVRAGLGTLAGGLVVAAGFGLFQKYIYDDVIDPSVSIPSGLLFVFGFAVSVGLPLLAQVLLGAAGITAAYLIPWSNYLTSDVRPPFIFDDQYPDAVVPLTVIASLVLAVFTLGYLWRKPLWRALSRLGAIGLDPLARLLVRRQPSRS